MVELRWTVQAPEKSPFHASDLIPAIPGTLAALFGIWAVHLLTRSREREKLALDVYRSILDEAALVAAACVSTWSAPKGAKRLRAVAETKWRLQRLGATSERLKILTSKTRWKRTAPFRQQVGVNLTPDMATLRQTLTADPFEDPDRRADSRRSPQVEEVIGDFVTKVEIRVTNWLG